MVVIFIIVLLSILCIFPSHAMNIDKLKYDILGSNISTAGMTNPSLQASEVQQKAAGAKFGTALWCSFFTNAAVCAANSPCEWADLPIPNCHRPW